MPLTHSVFSTTLQTDHTRIKNMHFFNSECRDALMPWGQQVNVSNAHLLLAESPHCKGSWDIFPEAMALSLYFSSLSPINYEWGYPADISGNFKYEYHQSNFATNFKISTQLNLTTKWVAIAHAKLAITMQERYGLLPVQITCQSLILWVRGLCCLSKHQWMSTSITVNSPSTVSLDVCGQLCSEKTLNRFYRTEEVTIHHRQRG